MTQAVTEDEIRVIYRATIDPLYGYVSRRCGGDRELAEDVAQETWMRAVREWRTSGVPDKPLAWLTTVARNLLMNQLRRRGTLPLEAAPPDALLALEEGGDSDETDRATAVTQALARLPLGQSRLLQAFHFDRRRVSDLAASFGITERAVEGRLRRARENLRRELEDAVHDQEGTR